MRGHLLSCVALFGVCACSSGSGTASVATPNQIAASPSALFFQVELGAPPSVPVTVSGARALDSNFAVSVLDPTVIGYTAPSISGRTATLSVFAIAPGSTSISFSDAGGSAVVTTGSGSPCGRPNNLSYASTLIAPAPGATSVPTNVGSLYFAVYSYVAPAANLHVIVGAHQSFEAGALAVASPPPGTPAAAPIAGQLLTYMKATVPQLSPGTSYRTELYGDTCEGALLAGSFST